MTPDEWIRAFAELIGTSPPDEKTVDALLGLAATAAHASERTAAPVACFLVGRVAVDPAQAAQLATQIGNG